MSAERSLLSKGEAPASALSPQHSALPHAVEIVFDGGSRGNPGKGYGSYRLRIGGERARLQRLSFGSPITSNEAEYRALIAALEDAAGTLGRLGRDPEQALLRVLGDSLLVLQQVAGRWKVRAPHLRPLRDRAAALVDRFGEARLDWQPREASLRVLGH